MTSSIINFSIGEELIPIELIYSLTLIKRAAAISNFLTVEMFSKLICVFCFLGCEF